jgi:hypothetical protein
VNRRPPGPEVAAAASAARDAGARLAASRARSSGTAEHRALRRAHLDARRVAGAMASALAMLVLMVLLQPLLDEAWRGLLRFWGARIQLDLVLAASGRIELPPAALPLARPGLVEFGTVGSAMVLLYATTLLFPDPLTPWKYLLRFFCLLQATALLFFLVPGTRFPYTLGWHLNGLLGTGRAVMLAGVLLTPLLEGLLGVRLSMRMGHAALMLAYFALLIPHELLVHAWLLQRGSILLMPLLYLGGGALLHVTVFVALLSWMLSSAVPPA